MRLIHKKLISFLFVAFVIISILGIGVGGKAYADTSLSGYSNVLDDLQKDDSFTISEYPAIDDDYSLQVIQIAESTAGELFVYVYQPAANVRELTATEIRISQSIGENIAPIDFKLQLLNRNGVFCKYIVDELTVKQDVVRYYDLLCIFRAWNGDIDKLTGNDNEIDFVQYEVAKLYTACTVDGVVTYSCEVENLVTITDKFVDFLRYPDGFKIGNWSMGSCDSHYVAFSCNYKIDELYSADVEYTFQSFHHPSSGSNNYGDLEIRYITLNSDKVSNPADGIGGVKYTWERIEKVSDFIANENVTDEVKAQLKNKQWVLRFAETSYSKSILPGSYGTVYDESKTIVSAVSILRLHFKSDGKVYNLGVIDDKRSADDRPGNEQEKTLWDYFIEFCKWLESITGLNYIVWAIILLAVPCGAVLGILSIFIAPLRFVLGKIFKGIGYGIYYVGYAIVWLVSRPFVGIKALIDKLRGN